MAKTNKELAVELVCSSLSILKPDEDGRLPSTTALIDAGAIAQAVEDLRNKLERIKD